MAGVFFSLRLPEIGWFSSLHYDTMSEATDTDPEYTEEERAYYNDQYETIVTYTCEYCRQPFSCTAVEKSLYHSCDMCDNDSVCDACVAWHDCGTTCCKDCYASYVFDPKFKHNA